MRPQTRNKKLIHIPIGLVIAGLAFALAVPVLAAYLGPNRTVTRTFPQYNIVQKSNHALLCVVYSPPPESVPVSGGCNEFSCDPNYPCSCSQYEYYVENPALYDIQDHTRSETVTYPPATVSGAIACGQPGSNGWCRAGGGIAVNSAEPVSGHFIYAIEGTRNGGSIFCWGSSCTFAMTEGDNSFTYWALSTFGDSSLMGSASGRLDSRPPVITGDLSGTAGNGDWFTSSVTITASATDPGPGSGLADFSYSVDGGAFQAYAAPFTVGIGEHTVTLQASDLAGNTSTTTVQVHVDNQPPVSNFTTTLPLSGWVRGDLLLTGVSSDPLSNVALVQVSFDGGAEWQAADGQSDWSYDWDTRTVPDGEYTLMARARDQAGNQENTAYLTVGVDNTPPALNLQVPGVVCVVCGGAEIRYVVADPSSGIAEWSLLVDSSLILASGQAAATGQKTWNGSGLAEGMHTLTLQARDKAGNQSEASVQVQLLAFTAQTPTGAASTLTPTRTPRPPTVTPRPTLLPGVTLTATVVRVIALPTVTQLPRMADYPDIYSSRQDFEQAMISRKEFLDSVIIGIALAALAAGAIFAAKKMLEKRSWEFEYRLATFGMSQAEIDQGYALVPEWARIVRGFDLLDYYDETGSKWGYYRTDMEVNQYLNLRKLFTEAGFPNNYDDSHANLCGQITVAALLGIPLVDALIMFSTIKNGQAILEDGSRGTTHEELMEFFKKFDWQAERRGGWGHQAWETAKDPDQPPAWNEIANLLNTGHAITTLVRINGEGVLCAEGTIQHWVSVLEVFQGDEGTFARVYNPFHNREEVYFWNVFEQSWAPRQKPDGSYFDTWYTAVVSKPPLPKVPVKPPKPKSIVVGKYQNLHAM